MRLPVILSCLCLTALAQTPNPLPSPIPSIVMPSYVAGGLAFNQLGTPRINGWIAGMIPVSSQVGVYASTTADVTPVTRLDTATGRTVYTASSQLRAGMHKTLYTGSKVQLLIGGDVGMAFIATATTPFQISLASSVTGTLVYQLSPHWGVIFPIRALYVATMGGWNPIVEFGVVWKPK